MTKPARFATTVVTCLTFASFALASAACSGVATGSDGTSGTSGTGFARGNDGTPTGATETGGGSSSGNSSGGQLGTPTSGKRFFVTSQTYDGNLKAKGGADALCQVAADGAELSGTYKAYVGTSSLPPTNGLAEGGPWYLTAAGGKLGFKAFNNKANLSTTPLVAIDTDERGRDIPYDSTSVWTGVSGDDCNGWTSNSYTAYGGAGSTHTANDTWRDSGKDSCNAKFRLYCVEQ